MQEGHNSTCLRFWSHVHGERVGVLRVYVSSHEAEVTVEDVIFERSGSQGDRWISEEIEFIMDSDTPIYITFEGNINSSDIGSIALDDVTIIPGHCPTLLGSMECNFDSSDCGWYQDETDDGDWNFISGSPPTSSNQPSHDHSLSKKGRYLYISGVQNMTDYTARLFSPIVTPGTEVSEVCFSFWYTALSGEVSGLSIALVEEGFTSTPAFNQTINITDNYGNVWRQARTTIPQLPSSQFSIVIEGKVKGQYILAIDDTALYYGPCPDDPSSVSTVTYIDGYQTLPASCAGWKRRGRVADGLFTVDPDGPGNGVQPFRVNCDMTSDPDTGIMVFTHDLIPDSPAPDSEEPYSYPFIVTYDGASLDQIAAAADISGECSQFIKLGCQEVALTDFTAWYDRYGARMDYWGGAPANSSMCACGSEGTCSAGQPCECDVKARFLLTKDEGNITQKDSLPVSEIRVGDTGGAYENADVTLGPLYCKGEDMRSVVTDRTDFVTLINSRNPGQIINEVDAPNVQECADACAEQAPTVCDSFSYQPSNGTCILKADGYQPATMIRDSVWNEYVRTWPRTEKPIACAFDGGGCGWMQDLSDDADWIISDGNHGYSRRTGPLSDHTSGHHQSGQRSVRLVGGATAYEGRAEIYYKNQWSTVCGVTLSPSSADILCRTLGFGEALLMETSNISYPQGTGEVVVDLQCDGGEEDIMRCPMRDIGDIECPHDVDARVVCSPGARLTGGATPREGTVEVLYDGEWGSVCHTNWDLDDADVLCRSLGYGGALSAVGSALYGEGSGQVVLDDVSCTGSDDWSSYSSVSESSILECNHSAIGNYSNSNSSCTHDEDAGVLCSYIDDPDFYPLKGSFIYVSSSEQSTTANVTRLISPPILMPFGYDAVCFRIWYFMFGDDVETLNVYVNDLDDDVGGGEIAFQISGDHGDQWILEQIDIAGNSTEPFTITIEVITRVGHAGDIAIDDIELLAGYCPYVPISCDFEDGFMCGFTQDEIDDADWMRGRGDIGHDDTRPPYDHTFQDVHGSYIYLNSNYTVPGSTALLWTPPYAFPGEHCLTFYYFMHGSEIGSLQVYAVESGEDVSESTPVWTRVGPQGYEWKKAVTPVQADMHFQIVFEAISGGTDYSNIAIDDVTILEGPCEVMEQDHVTNDVGCRQVAGDRLGVEDGRIPDSALSASSYNGSASEPYRARLNSYSPFAGWRPIDGDASSWLQVDFGLRRWITGALTQGLQQSLEWTTLIRFSYLNENTNRIHVSESECNISDGRVFRANYDSESIVTTLFPNPILSTNIRVHVDGSHINSALRCEILGMMDVDCDDLYTSGYRESGVYSLTPADGNGTMRAYCDMDTDEGGWTVFQRRLDGTTYFSKPWTDYENGFGDLSGEHWLGLENLRRIVGQRSYELRVELEYADRTRGAANYSSFWIGGGSTGYRLHVAGFNGDIDDPLAYHNGTIFRIPDQLPSNGIPSCESPRPSGGWWYVGDCDGLVNLNGVYPGTSAEASHDMFWNATSNDGGLALRFSEMKIKPIS